MCWESRMNESLKWSERAATNSEMAASRYYICYIRATTTTKKSPISINILPMGNKLHYSRARRFENEVYTQYYDCTFFQMF